MRTEIKICALCISIFIVGCGNNSPMQPPAPSNLLPFEASVTIDLSKKKPVNRKVLGNNIQWINHGDELLQKNSTNYFPDKVQSAKKMGVTVLRYPGGSLSDLYHWKDGLGSMDKRKRNLRFDELGDDKILLGTVEYLKLIRSLGAEPLITVNLATGTPQEAADWVRWTNITGVKDEQGKPLSKVKYWEIGNEPYLIGNVRKELAVQPEEFVKRANATIKAMKAVDPSIIVGIPLRSDKLGSNPATPMVGFNDKVLKAMKQPFEFVALHNAYFPFVYDNKTDINSLYLSIMSAKKFVKEDIEFTFGQLKKYFPNKKFQFAITEYNSFFTIGKGEETDGMISSLMGALYVADLLTMLAQMDDLLMANYWSLTGNWHFGAIRQDGKPRPSYYVLEGFNRVLNGQLVSTQIDTPTFKNVQAGFIPSADGIPCISSIVTQDKGKVTSLIINKHINLKAKINLSFKTPENVKSIKVQTLTADKFRPDDITMQAWSPFQPMQPGQPFVMEPHSIAIVEMEIG